MLTTRLGSTLALTLAMGWIAACGGAGDPVDQTEPSASADPEVTQADSLKLYVFDCGRLTFATVEAFGIADDETDVRELVVPCYVIEHPDGRLLWDGGLPSSVASGEGPETQRLDRTLAAQLPALDLDMAAFDYLAFSHLHFDHVGVANEVTGATWIVQRPEHEAAFADPVAVPSFDLALYGNLRDADTLVIDGDHDVFGDGRVRILSAPGHTPGHQVLFLDLAETGPLVLSGDLYHFRLSREDRRVPGFNTDADATLRSMEKVEAFVEETGATFWIEHDLALFDTLDKAPAYYE